MKAIIISLVVLTSSLFAAEGKDDFVYTIYIGEPVEKVWQTLINKHDDPPYYRNWIQKIELKIAGEIVYGSRNGPIYTGVITDIQVNSKLEHTINYAGVEQPVSKVSFELTPIASMCAVKITHSGLTDKHATYDEFCQDWPIIASALKTQAETGKPLPWPDPTKLGK